MNVGIKQGSHWHRNLQISGNREFRSRKTTVIPNLREFSGILLVSGSGPIVEDYRRVLGDEDLRRTKIKDRSNIETSFENVWGPPVSRHSYWESWRLSQRFFHLQCGRLTRMSLWKKCKNFLIMLKTLLCLWESLMMTISLSLLGGGGRQLEGTFPRTGSRLALIFFFKNFYFHKRFKSSRGWRVRSRIVCFDGEKN